ncbi:MAG: hypothetical protein ACW976_06795 [Candidatus Ranarchaeia archaeon]|jgi:hypothetical protein
MRKIKQNVSYSIVLLYLILIFFLFPIIRGPFSISLNPSQDNMGNMSHTNINSLDDLNLAQGFLPSFLLSAKAIGQWNFSYGGSGYEQGLSVVRCADDGYAMTGYTNSSGSGDFDVYLVRTNSTGHLLWNRTYGGSDIDYGYQVAQTPDGGFLIASQTESYGVGGSDVWLIRTNGAGIHLGITLGFNANSSDLWLIRTDAFGNHLWNSTIGGQDTDRCYSTNTVVECTNGDIAVAGYSLSYGPGGSDFWLVRTDNSGHVQWNQTYGGAELDRALSLIQCNDGGFALAGITKSFGAGDLDLWIVRTDPLGNHVWNQTWGGAIPDRGEDLVERADGSIVVAGSTSNFGAGGADFLLVCFNTTGHQLWNITVGGPNQETAQGVIKLGNLAYVLAGHTSSSGSSDFWLTRISINITVPVITNTTTSGNTSTSEPPPTITYPVDIPPIFFFGGGLGVLTIVVVVVIMLYKRQ